MVPFVAGLAVGGLAVFALGNKKELSKVAQRGYEKSKEVANDIKKSAISTAECIKQKMEKEDVAEAKTTATKTTKTSTKRKKDSNE